MRVRQMASVGPWISFTPEITAESGAWSNYTATGFYRVVDKMLEGSFKIAFTGTSGAATGMYITLPAGLIIDTTVLAGGGSWDTDLVGYSIFNDSGTVSGVPGIVNTRNSTKFTVKYFYVVASSYARGDGLTNTTPWTWTTQDIITGTFRVPIT